ncbi:MAG: 3-oxoacyl-ACP reductase [Pseudonocardiales bacterium]|nr:MAG: 3-oxoacyl-ACP reductase [Pseudonocardiales bacterium]
MSELTGRRSLVLCGTRGIGLGVAQCLARDGSVVTVSGTDQARADQVADALPGSGHTGFSCDFAKPILVGHKVADTAPYDVVLLNTPGAAPGRIDAMSGEELALSADLMLLSLHHAVTAALPDMKANGWGRFIAITSTSVSSPIGGLAASSIMRAAVQSYLRLLAESVGAFGITVNHVIPGKIDTDRLHAVDTALAEHRGTDVGSLRDETVRSIPLGRYGRPEDVGELVSFLAGDRASYITGAGIRCDGGYLRSL